MTPTLSARTDAQDTAPTPTRAAPLLVDSRAACALLSMGERRLWQLTNCNAIPHRKIGRSVRYSPAELEAWIAGGCPTEPGAAARVRKGVAR